jgi:autotransporter-associated beta strand protein
MMRLHLMRSFCAPVALVLAATFGLSHSAVAQVDPLSFVKIIPVDDGNPATNDLGFDHWINSTAFKIQSLQTVGNYQFIVYYDEGTNNTNRNVTVARRDITNPANIWSITHTNFTSFNSTDAHNVISFGIDGAGYMHLSWGMHNNNLLYTRSTAPVVNNLPMSFVGQGAGNSGAINTMVGTNETQVTYPNFYNIPGTDDLLFNYRTGSSGDGTYRLSKYDTSEGTWAFTRQNWIVNTDSSGLNYNAYPHNMVYDSQGGLHASWTIRYNSDSPAGESGYQTNHNIYYGYSPDDGVTWYRDVGGTIPYTGPINNQTSQVVLDIPEGSSLINTGTMTVDRHDNPVIATWWAPDAHASDPDHRRQYMLAWYDGDDWQTSQITQRRVDSSSYKTPESALSNHFMGRPQVLVDDYNRAFVVYNDNEGLTNVTVAVSQAESRDDWVLYELNDVPTGTGTDHIELTVDHGRWAQDRTLSVFYQPQIGGNASPVSVLEWNTYLALGRVLKWTGNASGVWNNSDINFVDRDTPDDFDNYDNVTFDDSATQKTIEFAGAVAAGTVVVDTQGTYTFTGPGALTAGSLAVVGGGTLELATSGNTYSGQTRVSNATLRVTGDASAMVSPIVVAAGGRLELATTAIEGITSSLDVWKTGEVIVGTPGGDGNVFPDSWSQIINDGKIRVYQNETLNDVQGEGAIVAEGGVVLLESNPQFRGTVAARAGATVVASSSTALGTGGLDIAGNGDGSGAIRVVGGSEVVLGGRNTLSSPAAELRVESGSTVILNGPITGTGGMVKSGGGYLGISAESNYSGATVVAGGTLELDGTTGGGDTIVAGGALMSGRGIVTGNLVAQQGSTLRPSIVAAGAAYPRLIDDFADDRLTEYTQYTVLNFDEQVESTFFLQNGGLAASTTDTDNSPEQSAFVRPFSGLAVGETLVVDANLDSNIGAAVNIFDYGLLIADSGELRNGSRNQYLYVASRISSNPDVLLARYWDSNSADSPGDVNVNGGAGVNVQSPKATQFFIKRTGQTSYALGYSTNNLETLIQYGSEVTVESSFEPDLVGFYSDARGGNGTTNFTATSGTFDNLRIIRDDVLSTRFTVGGNLTLESGATLEMMIESATRYSQLSVAGTLSLAGSLRVDFAGGFAPAPGQEFDLFDFAAVEGGFETAMLPVLPVGLRWDTSRLPVDGVLAVSSGLAADFNGDGKVDALDYVVWRNNLEATGPGLAADANGDLRVDEADFIVWKSMFGAEMPPGGLVGVRVPEPGTLSVATMVIGLCLLAANRRKMMFQPVSHP